MNQLKGRRILISGTSKGIGRESVKLFTQEGAEIIGLARDGAKLKSLEGECPGFQGLAGDVTDKNFLRQVAKAVEARWGALDILVNNAAMLSYNAGLEAESTDTFEQTFTLNLFAPNRVIHALLPLLNKGNEPRIVNVSSGAGKFKVLREEPNMPAYRLSKYALNGLTIVASENFKGKIAVNSLDPGWLKTDMGGPEAPGEAKDGAQRMLAVATKPFSVTGKFFYGADEIEF